MEKQNQNIRSWDDLIFENRNKAYGAYALRQDYNNGVTKGALTGIGILVSIFILAGIVSKNPDIIPTITEDGPIICLFDPPVIVPIDIPKTTTPPVRTVSANLVPIAVTTLDPVQPDPDPVTTSGTEGTTDGTATSDTGTSGSVDTGGTELGTVAVTSNKPFIHVEIMPEYKGGLKGMIKTLQKNQRYPASARRMGKEGTVFVEFVVSDEGEVVDVKVIKGFDLDCDKEAVRMVEKLTEWTPGMQNKIAVNVKMVLPIKFQLEQQ